MPMVKEIEQPIKAITETDAATAYLVVGERFLVKDAVARLVAALLPHSSSGTLHEIDGDEEDASRVLSLLRTYSMFPGRQVVLVRDTRIFHSKTNTAQLWSAVEQAAQENNTTKAGARLRAFVEAAGLKPLDVAYDDLGQVGPAQWKELFGMDRPQGDLSWTGPLLEELKKKAGKKAGKKGLGDADAYMAALEGELPEGHILVMTAETVDKRTRLFKCMKEHGVVVDLSVAAGSSRNARDAQNAAVRDVVARTLAGFGKKAGPGVMDGLLQRVGFHPAAACNEAEKLALYAGDRDTVTREDLDLLVGRTSEEALYELTEQVAARNLAAALASLQRLREDRVHELAIVATLRNFLLKLLGCRALIDKSAIGYRRGISFGAFQKTCHAALKGEDGLKDLVGGHPFAVYKLFERAASFELSRLRRMLASLLEVEFRLKSGPLDSGMLLEDYLMAHLPGTHTHDDRNT